MTKPPDFTAQLTELEAITEWFESDKVDLGEALAKFERGMELAGNLKKELEHVENRIETIKAKFDAPVPPVASEPTSVDIDQNLFS